MGSRSSLCHVQPMPGFLHEWLNVLVRWAHIVAAIMWIGDSFLFMWLDSHLNKTLLKPREGDVVGELYMTHSGGFYEVVKRKTLKKEELPPVLYWFKWESYSTWITGFLLLIIVYWLGGRAMLLESSSSLSYPTAVGISGGLLVAGVAVYNLLCATPVKTNNRVFGAVGWVLIVATAYGLMQVFTARAVYLQVGAMLGTIMAVNVFNRIIPSQRHMLAATEAGQPVDASYGVRAKLHSTHNHYLTLPVLFMMLSNHFPSLYGHNQGWLMLGLLCLVGVGIKYTMNFRGQTHPVILIGVLAAIIAAVAMTAPAARSQPTTTTATAAVEFAQVRTILEARCLSCHAKQPANPAFAAPPAGLMLENPADVVANKDKILTRAVETKTMPLGNLTGMTDDERVVLGQWIAQGARLQ
jgi:uncharacterized membrane protein